MVYVYQKESLSFIKFISNKITSNSIEKSTYINSLLLEAFEIEYISFANHFYKESLLKKIKKDYFLKGEILE